MIFALFALEREPLQWKDFPTALMAWLQNAGFIAAIAMTLWVIARLAQRFDRRQKPLPAIVKLAFLIGLGGYGLIVLFFFASLFGVSIAQTWLPRARSGLPWSIGDYIVLVSGTVTLLTVLTPILLDIFQRIRWGRIWALARLSLKEAMRSRVFLIFAAIALVFLFGQWFIPVEIKAEDQIRTYVKLVYWSIMPIFLISISLLGSFSIPNDVKSLSIHTIVTKPVEKFEIVLGRFLGYGLLMTVGLAVVSLLSLVYIQRGVQVTEVAQEESFKARVPIFGELRFHNTKRADRGESVGREWDYRSYITSPSLAHKEIPIQYAFWKFRDLPTDLSQRPQPIRFEFTFDIFRLSKGVEGEGIPCTFTFAEGKWTISEVMEKIDEMDRETKKDIEKARSVRDKARAKETDSKKKEELEENFKQDRLAIEQEAMKHYKIFQLKGKPVTDYHTQTLDVPQSFFAALPAESFEADAPAPMQVIVNVESSTGENQMLGMAQRDLYLLAEEKPFWQNFLKGIIGLWFTFIIILGIAVTCSTYFTGIISWLCTMFLFCAGLFPDFLQRVAEHRVQGGGPAEALARIITNKPVSAPMHDSPGGSILISLDSFFSWWVGLFINIVPDISRYDLQIYVANGFDISWTRILLLDNFLPLAGYLLPWAVLAYYMMKSREIANPT